MNLIRNDQHTRVEIEAAEANGTPLRTLLAPWYEGDPEVIIAGETFRYDPKGENGPELLNHNLGHPRQAESDANWPGGKPMKRARRRERADANLEELDRKAIRHMRKYLAAQADADAEIVSLEAEAVAERAHSSKP